MYENNNSEIEAITEQIDNIPTDETHGNSAHINDPGTIMDENNATETEAITEQISKIPTDETLGNQTDNAHSHQEQGAMDVTVTRKLDLMKAI